MELTSDLIMVRHGRSEPNEIQAMIKQDPGHEPPEGFYDRHDSEMRLSEEGILQANEAGASLDERYPKGFDHYITSPLVRTMETAVQLRLNGAWKINDLWRERDWGEYGILNEVQREEMYEMSKRLKDQNKWYWCPPGGESLATGLRLRFERALRTFEGMVDKKILVVTHGEVIDVAGFVLERLTPIEWLERNEDRAYRIGNGQEVHYTPRDPDTGKVAHDVLWRRSINAFNPEYDWDNGDWVEIRHKKYSDQELAAWVALFPPLLRGADVQIERV